LVRRDCNGAAGALGTKSSKALGEQMAARKDELLSEFS
jgi:hypothetical protein